MKLTPPTVKIGATLTLAACGMAVLVYLHPEKLKAPAWVAFSAVGLLGFAGACVIVQALRWNDLARWLVCALLGGMTVIPAWIALGSGSRQCSAVSFGLRSAVSEAMCRGVFGVSTVILAALFAVAVRAALRARQAS
jgi:hypothetical protein